MSRSNKYFSIEKITTKQSWNIRFIIIFIVGFSLLNVYLNPYKQIFELFHVHSPNGCPLLTFTGVPCPTCGMGRAFSCITDLHFAESMYYNPLGILFYLISGLIVLIILILSLQNKMIKLKDSSYKLWYMPVIFILIMWMLNIFFGHH